MAASKKKGVQSRSGKREPAGMKKTVKAAAKNKVKKKTIKKRPGKKIDNQKLKTRVEKKAKRVSDRDVQDLIEREKEIDEKLRAMPTAFQKLVNRLRLLNEMVRDYWRGDYKEIPWYSIAIAVAALLYFINPFDAVFDIIPGIGYIDDVVVIGLVFKSIREDLKTYCTYKGYDAQEYF